MKLCQCSHWWKKERQEALLVIWHKAYLALPNESAYMICSRLRQQPIVKHTPNRGLKVSMKRWSENDLMHNKTGSVFRGIKQLAESNGTSTFNGLQFRRWQCGSIFIRLAVVASKMCEITRKKFGLIAVHVFPTTPLFDAPSVEEEPVRIFGWNYIFYNNFNKKCPITIIFGIVSSQSRRHRKMVSFPTSPI